MHKNVNELGISKPHAYKLIKQMNEELSKNGYIIVNGRVPRNYFYEWLKAWRGYNKDKSSINYIRSYTGVYRRKCRYA